MSLLIYCVHLKSLITQKSCLEFFLDTNNFSTNLWHLSLSYFNLIMLKSGLVIYNMQSWVRLLSVQNGKNGTIRTLFLYIFDYVTLIVFVHILLPSEFILFVYVIFFFSIWNFMDCSVLLLLYFQHLASVTWFSLTLYSNEPICAYFQVTIVIWHRGDN